MNGDQKYPFGKGSGVLERNNVMNYKIISFYGILAIIIGVIVGAVDTVFGRMLIAITEYRDARPQFLLPFLALAGLVIVFAYQKFGKNTVKGMGLVFSAGNTQEEEIPKRMIPLVVGGTWLTHLFGGSAGREGVAVQIGATVGHTFGKRLPFYDAKRIMLVTGMAAGFAGLFETPIAATFFALEVLAVGRIDYQSLFPAAIGAFVASYTSHFLGLEKFTHSLDAEIAMDLPLVMKLLVLGIVFGVVGGFFAKALADTKKWLSERLTNPYRRIFFMGLGLSVVLMLLQTGRYSGLGTNLINASFHNEAIHGYDWILKAVLTILTLAAGFQGGEVTPLFSIGASLGYWLAPFLGLPTEFVAALGYASVFASATNTFMAPIFIGAEIFGYAYLPYFFTVVGIAYVFNNNRSIYTGQLNNFI